MVGMGGIFRSVVVVRQQSILIEHRKLAELTPYPRNPRRHSDAQIAQIAGSIAQFGFNSPILIDSKGNIIAGHGRYLASLKLGLDTVPVIVLDHLSETEKRAYLLADNQLATSNVIEVKSESSQGAHSAPFPRALVEFFVKAFSDESDLVFDPFLGSATSIAAAHVLGRPGRSPRKLAARSGSG